MAMTTPTTLPCGRDLGRLWDHLDQPPDTHERACPFCQQARARALHVTALSTAMVNHDRSNPDMKIGSSVKNAILDVARTEVRRSRTISLERPHPGETTPSLTVSELVVSDVARAVADTLPGARIRHCQVDYLDQPPSDVAGQPAQVGLTITTATSVTAQLPDLLPRLRDRVREAIDQEIGLDVRAINITVEDLYDA